MLIKRELAQHGIFPKKRLGQHFLVDPNVLQQVIEAACVEKDDVVLEIGPGPGEMTLALASQVKRVIAVEIDPRMAELLKQKISGHSNIEIVTKDILKLDFKSLYEQEGRPIKVVSNLPYQISTPLLFQFIEDKEAFSTITLMLQKEVAERMAAPSGGRDYGTLSVLAQIFLDFTICFTVPPSAFFPPPKVESAVIHMVWKEKPLVDRPDEKWFKKVVKAGFSHRRKTLANSLKHSGLPLPQPFESRMEQIGIDSKRRPETLTLQEFVKLAEVLKE